MDADSREKRSGRINGASIQTRAPILSASVVFGTRDIDLGPPNYFQDGDRCIRGPSTVSIEAIFGSLDWRGGQYLVSLLSFQALRISWPPTDARPIGHTRKPAPNRFRTVFVDMSAGRSLPALCPPAPRRRSPCLIAPWHRSDTVVSI